MVISVSSTHVFNQLPQPPDMDPLVGRQLRMEAHAQNIALSDGDNIPGVVLGFGDGDSLLHAVQPTGQFGEHLYVAADDLLHDGCSDENTAKG